MFGGRFGGGGGALDQLNNPLVQGAGPSRWSNGGAMRAPATMGGRDTVVPMQGVIVMHTACNPDELLSKRIATCSNARMPSPWGMPSKTEDMCPVQYELAFSDVAINPYNTVRDAMWDRNKHIGGFGSQTWHPEIFTNFRGWMWDPRTQQAPRWIGVVETPIDPSAKGNALVHKKNVTRIHGTSDVALPMGSDHVPLGVPVYWDYPPMDREIAAQYIEDSTLDFEAANKNLNLPIGRRPAVVRVLDFSRNGTCSLLASMARSAEEQGIKRVSPDEAKDALVRLVCSQSTTIPEIMSAWTEYRLATGKDFGADLFGAIADSVFQGSQATNRTSVSRAAIAAFINQPFEDNKSLSDARIRLMDFENHVGSLFAEPEARCISVQLLEYARMALSSTVSQFSAVLQSHYIDPATYKTVNAANAAVDLQRIATTTFAIGATMCHCNFFLSRMMGISTKPGGPGGDFGLLINRYWAGQ